ncbi:MAG: hypothetical protein IPK74_01550 [Deltaproteobacteria bacterium]|nr:hypothetical protein [Deltaproteobacteria bacterium]
MRMRARPVAAAGFALGVAGSFALAGEGCLTCNESLCNSRLAITIREPSGALRPGVWAFEFVVDDAQTLHARCEIGADSRTAHCDAGDLDVSPVIVDDPDNPYTFFLTAFEGDAGVEDLPTTLDVRVTVEDAVVLERRFEPHYELTEPARCDPDCFSDSLALRVARG